jgi:UDP-glucose 4-epimerase
MPPRKGVLLIGGSGFLGLALAKALARAGREVHVLSRNTQPGKAKGIIFHRGSQDDPAIVPPLLKACGTVVHLASTTTPGSSARQPVLDAEENLLPAARLAELMSASPPVRLVFVSSGGAIYGNPSQLPVDESLAPRPLSYHAAGKVAMEALFTAFAHANDVTMAVLRPSNIYGPGQQLRTGFGLIRTLLYKAMTNTPVEIWGDGNAVRDHLFIDDAVAACMHLVKNAQATGAFNAGSGTGTSIVDLITLVRQITSHDLEVTQRPARSTDVRAIVLDSTRLQNVTGWYPNTDLEQGMRTTWEWMQEGAP